MNETMLHNYPWKQEIGKKTVNFLGATIMKGRGGNPGLRGRLLDKSIEAYILSLETIDRLSIKYRAETFAYLICNAWELLLKAKILQDTKNKEAIYYFKKEMREDDASRSAKGLAAPLNPTVGDFCEALNFF